MLVNSERACAPFVANDGCLIRELLHPANEGIELGFSLAIAEVAVGERTYRHRMGHAEVYYLIAGQGVVHIDDESRDVVSGDAVYIPGGAVQWIENSGNVVLKFAAIVAPPWSAADDERL